MFKTALLALFLVFSTVKADAYDPPLGSSINLYEKTQYLVATSFANGVESATYSPFPGFDWSTNYADAGPDTYLMAFEPENKRTLTMAFKNHDGYDTNFAIYTTATGTFVVTNSWNSTTGTLTGPKTCSFSPLTFDSHAAAYGSVRKIGENVGKNEFVGLVSHAGSCNKKTAWFATVNKQGNLISAITATTVPRGAGSSDQNLISHQKLEFVSQAGIDESLWQVPALCSGNLVAYCTRFDH